MPASGGSPATSPELLGSFPRWSVAVAWFILIGQFLPLVLIECSVLRMRRCIRSLLVTLQYPDHDSQPMTRNECAFPWRSLRESPACVLSNTCGGFVRWVRLRARVRRQSYVVYALGQFRMTASRNVRRSLGFGENPPSRSRDQSPGAAIRSAIRKPAVGVLS